MVATETIVRIVLPLQILQPPQSPRLISVGGFQSIFSLRVIHVLVELIVPAGCVHCVSGSARPGINSVVDGAVFPPTEDQRKDVHRLAIRERRVCHGKSLNALLAVDLEKNRRKVCVWVLLDEGAERIERVSHRRNVESLEVGGVDVLEPPIQTVYLLGSAVSLGRQVAPVDIRLGIVDGSQVFPRFRPFTRFGRVASVHRKGCRPTGDDQ